MAAGALLGQPGPLAVPFGVPAIRMIPGVFSTANVTNVGCAAAWVQVGAGGRIGSGTVIRPNVTVRLPPTDPAQGLWVISEPGGAMLDFLIVA